MKLEKEIAFTAEKNRIENLIEDRKYDKIRTQEKSILDGMCKKRIDGRCASRISSKFKPCALKCKWSARASRLSTYKKRSSSWLSTLPLRSLGYCLNKKDFRDSLLLRYNWPIPDVCKHCACGMSNSVNHALTCKKGGYVTFRHDILVETEAELLREAKCRNVYTEPSLLPTIGLS